ncbi:sensor dcuS domain protein [Escherichia coli]|nr:sensor dcuS domain protein [Escherichia coli]
MDIGFAPIFPDTCYHLTHYWIAAADIPVASDNPTHYADAIRYMDLPLYFQTPVIT